MKYHKNLTFIELLSMVCLIMACQNNNESKEVLAHRTESINEFISIPTNKDGKIDTTDFPKIEFAENYHDFDTIQEGDTIYHTFVFKNTGKSPLKVLDVKSTCGCTVPEYSKEKINVGKQGEINVMFNSKGKSGYQNKVITIFANTYPNRTKLYLRGYVLEKSNKSQ